MVEENQPLIPLRWQEMVNLESTENDNHIPGDGEVFQTVETPWNSDGSVWYGPCDSLARSSPSPGPTEWPQWPQKLRDTTTEVHQGREGGGKKKSFGALEKNLLNSVVF